MKSLLICLLGFAAFLGVMMSNAWSADVSSSAPVRADRRPMGFRNQGLYSGFGAREQTEGGGANLLPAGRAAGDASPWSFYIFQYNGALQPKPDTASGRQAEIIREMAAHGKRVVLRIRLQTRETRHNYGKMDPEACYKAVEYALTRINPDWLYAIVLDEEGIYWNGHAEVLSELYHRVKKRWPELPVYQWYTPIKGLDFSGKTGWAPLPADGWICDLYVVRREAFERKLLSFLRTGKPVISISFAAPTHVLKGRFTGMSPADFWQNEGAPALQEQLDVCRAYDIPVAYYIAQPRVIRDGKQISPVYWGWTATDPIVRKMYQQVELLAIEARSVPDWAIGYRTPSEKLFEWSAHRNEPTYPIRLSLDDNHQTRVDADYPLEDPVVSPGRHLLGTSNPYLRIAYTVDDSAKDLFAASPYFAVRGLENHKVSVPILFEIQSPKIMEKLSVELDVTVIAGLGGRCRVQTSLDGRTWSDPLPVDAKKPKQTLRTEIAGPGVAGRKVFVRVILEASSGKPTRPAAELKQMRLAAWVR